MGKIITLAREYGSGGRIIAQKVAQQLGIHYYNNEIIDEVAKELGIYIVHLRKIAEQKSSGLMYTMASSVNALPFFDQVYLSQIKVIRHLATQGDCIIVNGVADYILNDHDDMVRVFVHSPLTSRMNRVKNVYQESCEDLKRYVKNKDKKRKNYYNYYTMQKWKQVENYDLVINSDIGIDESVAAIVAIYHKSKAS